MLSSTFHKFNSNLSDLLKKKGLPTQGFIPTGITLDNDMALHAKHAYQFIYSIHYPNTPFPYDHGIARVRHGIQHVSRAAVYAVAFANLYRRYGSIEALTLTDEGMKLIQISVLFHDAGREAEGKDLWDNDSGLLLYYYLTQVLNVAHEKAKLCAEAIANKDINKTGYIELIEKENGELEWLTTINKPKKNIYQKLIHDADCLDIIRARDHFDANHLDFYQEIASKDNPIAFDEMASIIIEARGLIQKQGDIKAMLRLDIKKHYEHENAYTAICDDLNQNDFLGKILPALYANGRLLAVEALQDNLLKQHSSNPEQNETEENMRVAMQQGKLFARGIATPSAFGDKHTQETLAQLELRKAKRRPHVPTQKKALGKHGNNGRSVSMLGWGASVYYSAGYLLHGLKLEDVGNVSFENASTGRGKKEYFHNTETNPEKKQMELTHLLRKQKMGGSSQRNGDRLTTHNEIIYKIRKYQGVFYTNDPVAQNKFARVLPEGPELQAIHLQYEYHRVYGKWLPIFQYSGLLNEMTLRPPYSEEEIIEKWVVLCTAYMTKKLNDGYCISKASLEEIKISSMYEPSPMRKLAYAPVDLFYSTALREKINLHIEAARKQCIDQNTATTKKGFLENKLSILSDKGFSFLFGYTKDAMEVKDNIYEELDDIFTTNWNEWIKRFRKCRLYNNGYEPIKKLEEYHKINLEDFSHRDDGYNFLRLYAIACLLGYQDGIDKIKAMVTHYVNDVLNMPYSLNNWFSISSQNEHLEKALQMAAYVGIYTHFDKQIHAWVDRALDNFQIYIDAEYIYEFQLSVSFISEFMPLNITQLAKLEAIFNELNVVDDKVKSSDHIHNSMKERKNIIDGHIQKIKNTMEQEKEFIQNTKLCQSDWPQPLPYYQSSMDFIANNPYSRFYHKNPEVSVSTSTSQAIPFPPIRAHTWG